MKYSKYLSGIIIIVLTQLFFGCQQNLQPGNDLTKNLNPISTKKILDDKFLGNDNIEFIGSLEARAEISWDATPSIDYYNYSCDIFQSPNSNDRIDVGDVTISDNIITNPDNNYSYDSVLNPDDKNTPKFGKTTKWSIEGNSNYNIPIFDTTMYIPKELEITNNNIPQEFHFDLNRNNDFKITWNKDIQNENDVYIILSEVPTQEGQDTFFWYDKTSDNGTYTINSSVLKQIPLSSSINLFLIRGNGMIVTKNDKNFLLLGYSRIQMNFKTIE